MDDQNPQNSNPNSPASNDPRQQIVERLKQANNVLVTVNSNPSVDQLSACIGLTLILNKLNKHATAVFSGEVPSTIEFLQPEETLEKNTDSLRDFIISLDKAKADKLRYKVEDKVVKIFITPYRTSISEKDLEFSQGDFNVDVVVALGVHEQKDLDQAITAHGRILHDAAVTTISTTVPSTLGSVNWQDAGASSLSELITSIGEDLGPKLLDGQIATALLTGIVAETQRFSNEKTSPRTMSASAALMSAGANQQLVATKLEPPKPPEPDQPDSQPPAGPPPDKPPSQPPNDTLAVHHDDELANDQSPEAMAEKIDAVREQQQIHIDNEGKLHILSETAPPPADQPPAGNQRSAMQEPPIFDGALTAEAKPEPVDPSTDALSLPKVEQPILSHDNVAPAPVLTPTPPLPTPGPDETLTEIEKNVESPHVNQVDVDPQATDIESLSNAAKDAAAESEPLPTPQAFGSQYAVDSIHPEDAQPPAGPPAPTLTPMPPSMPEPAADPDAHEQMPAASPADQALTMQLPPNPFPANLVPPAPPAVQPFTNAPTDNPTPPPPVPPPMTLPSP